MAQTALKSQLSQERKYEKKLHLMLKEARLGLIIEDLSFNVIPSYVSPAILLCLTPRGNVQRPPLIMCRFEIQITLDVKREIKRVPRSAQAVLLLLLSFEDSLSFCYLFPSHPS